MKASEFINKLQNIVDNYKTLYVMGCFGAPLTGANVSRYCTNHRYNKQAARTAMIRAAADKNPPVYGFDCAMPYQRRSLGLERKRREAIRRRGLCFQRRSRSWGRHHDYEVFRRVR